MQHVLDAIQSDADGDVFAKLPIPDSYRAVHVLQSEQEMWKGVATKDKDPRRSLHVGEVPTPPVAPDEVYVAVSGTPVISAAGAPAVPWPLVGWFGGYGILCYIAGLIVLRFRRLAIV